MKRASIPGWVILRHLLQRDGTVQAAAVLGKLPAPSPTDKAASPVHKPALNRALRGVALLVPASLIGSFFARRRSAVHVLAGVFGAAAMLLICLAVLEDRRRYAQLNSEAAERTDLGRELNSIEAAMLRIAGELGDPAFDRMDRALRA